MSTRYRKSVIAVIANNKYQKGSYYLSAHWLYGDVLLNHDIFLIFAVFVVQRSHCGQQICKTFKTVNVFTTIINRSCICGFFARIYYFSRKQKKNEIDTVIVSECHLDIWEVLERHDAWRAVAAGHLWHLYHQYHPPRQLVLLAQSHQCAQSYLVHNAIPQIIRTLVYLLTYTVLIGYTAIATMKFLNANRRMKTPKMSTKIHDQIFLNHTKVKKHETTGLEKAGPLLQWWRRQRLFNKITNKTSAITYQMSWRRINNWQT